MTRIHENLAKIHDRMANAAKRAGRNPDEVKLVAVSKRVAVDRVQEAVAAGQLLFGENFIQEAQEKIPVVSGAVNWHFIGHLQSNKVKLAAQLFQTIETVDRRKIVDGLEKQLTDLQKDMSVFVQVNIGRESQKGGVLPEETEALVRYVLERPHLKLQGLMAMPPFFSEPEKVRPFFRQMRQLAEQLEKMGLTGDHGKLDLSMGMSGDFEVAIEEGATHVRVGTALFGSRQKY